jgi:predicted PurR-regulated permease PerM
MDDRERRSGPDEAGHTRRVVKTIAIVSAFVVAGLLLYHAAEVFLLLFAGVLIAVLLRGLSDLLSGATGLPAGGSLAVVGVVLLALLGLGGWFLASEIAAQFDQLGQKLTQALHSLEKRLQQYEWGRQLLAQSPTAGQLMSGRFDVLGRITGLFSSALGVIANVFIVLFIGIYVAVNPGVYRRGLLHLIPPAQRERARETLDAVDLTLRWWLLGRLLDMTVVGVLTSVGLMFLGVPAPIALGLLAFVLVFIPYLGPILSAVPAVLIAWMTMSAADALYVALFYIGLQTVESYLLQPLIQERSIRLPPAVIISAQVLMGVLVGTLGVMFATPLAAAVAVAVKMLYVEDTLGDAITVKAEQQIRPDASA